MAWIYLAVLVVTFGCARAQGDSVQVPCSPRTFPDGIVCVCNATYCDTLVRAGLNSNAPCAIYTTSQAGKRFERTTAEIKTGTLTLVDKTLALVTGTVIVEVGDVASDANPIWGFGGAITDSSIYNTESLSEPVQDCLIRSLFGDDGLEWNHARLPTGGTDFSTRSYTYCDWPCSDPSGWSLQPEDYAKIPYIKQFEAIANSRADEFSCKGRFNLMSSIWGYPEYMKTKNSTNGWNCLKDEYIDEAIKYLLWFVKAYASYGIHIGAVGVSNEPANCMGLGPLVAGDIPCTGITPEQACDITFGLREQLDNCSLNDTLILSPENQLYDSPIYWTAMKKCWEYITPALHGYGDFLPEEILALVPDALKKFGLLRTEYCTVPGPLEDAVILASQARTEDICLKLLDNLANGGITMDMVWNYILDLTGGPCYIDNKVDAPLIANAENDEFYKQPTFYYLAHFSKFITPCSLRLDVTRQTDIIVKSVAFSTARDTIALVLINPGEFTKTVRIQNGDKYIETEMEPHSIQTAEILYASI